MKRLLSFLGAAILCSGLAFAAPPAWWSAPATRIIDPQAAQHNYGPANLGQLKNFAEQARKHLDAELASLGGAGAAITTMVANFEPKEGVSYTGAELAAIMAANHAPANLGQLKAVAKPFYDRLLAVGYATRINLIARGYPQSWPHQYPWDPQTPIAANYAHVTIGQLKMAFSFSVTGFNPNDTDADGLPDSWENSFTGTLYTLNGDGTHDADQDGVSDLAEYQIGWSPVADERTDPAKTESLSYDAAHRLITVTGRSALGYSPDPAGNLLQATQP
jgi:hypothetical protein